MRKVILYMMMSLDGFLSGPHGELDWMIPIEDEGAIEMGLIDKVDTALIGHGSYKEMSEYWQAAAEDASSSQIELEFAKKMNDITKLVFSTTEEKLAWKNARQVLVKDNDELAKEVAGLKAQSGGDMVLYGGVRLAQTFVQLNLIDEYRLVVHPVMLGSGNPLFKGKRDKVNLKLINTKHDSSGVVLLWYEPETK